MACHCPTTPALDEVSSVEAIPTGPVRCECCGSPLRLTCDGECSAEHVEASMQRARDTIKSSRVAGIAQGTMREPREPREPHTATSTPRAEHHCDRCGAAIPPARGRPSLSCDRCLTPTERKRRETAAIAKRAKDAHAKDAARITVDEVTGDEVTT